MKPPKSKPPAKTPKTPAKAPTPGATPVAPPCLIQNGPRGVIAHVLVRVACPHPHGLKDPFLATLYVDGVDDLLVVHDSAFLPAAQGYPNPVRDDGSDGAETFLATSEQIVTMYPDGSFGVYLVEPTSVPVLSAALSWRAP